MTSLTTPHIPPIIADLPTLVNCCTAEFPPIITLSSISACPPNGTLLAKITLSPTIQSCAICDETIKRQLFPILVNPPPPLVPGLIVTYSLILLLSPISKLVFSPLNFKSCGSLPIDEKGYILLFLPILVLPTILT